MFKKKDEFDLRESRDYRLRKFDGYWYRVKRGKRRIWVLKEELLPDDKKIGKGRPSVSPPHFHDYSRSPIPLGPARR